MRFLAFKNNPEYLEMSPSKRTILNIKFLYNTMTALYEGKESQKRALMILLQTGDITQRELTRRLCITPASVSELLTKLETDGMLVRTQSKTDRRLLILSLTEKGKAAARKYTNAREQSQQEMFACLSEEEKAALLLALEKLNLDWDEKYR
ncbi:MAG: MarR family transcriptional regulator [Ruminococcus sp.]|nr:MarR family transcriptional regulator [Ruminococcus sp.]